MVVFGKFIYFIVMNKNFWNSFWSGFCAFSPVAAGAIGGMIIMRGANNNEICTIILGIFVVVVNMLVNKFNQHELMKKD